MGVAVGLLVLLASGCTREPLAGIGEVRVQLGDDPAWARPAHDAATWERVHWSEVGHHQAWWLRTEVTVPQSLLDTGQPLGLYLFAMASAEVYWDGELLGRNGQPAALAEEEVPGTIAAVIPLPTGLDDAPHVLAIRWSSHSAGARVRTPVDALFIGAYGSPLRFSRDLYLPSLVVGGALVLAGALLVGLAIRGRDAATAWLAVAVLGALAQLCFETSRAFLSYPYPLHSLRLASIGAAAGITGLSLLGFAFARFGGGRRSWPWLAVHGAIVFGTLALLRLGDENAFLSYALAAVGGCLVTGMAWRRGEPAAGPALTAFLAFGLLLYLTEGGFLDLAFYFGLTAFLLFFLVEHVRAFFRSRSERERAELKAARLELELAKRHLQPHFLLNTLATLGELIETDPPLAARLIDLLGEEFRVLNALSQNRTVSLEEELALCHAHLAVMSLRFETPLTLDVEGDTDRRTIAVPPVVLHTLIENALTHNRFGPGGAHFMVSITTGADGHEIVLAAPRGEATVRTGSGLGGEYIRARLEEAFGSRARMSEEATAAAWITRLALPR